MSWNILHFFEATLPAVHFFLIIESLFLVSVLCHMLFFGGDIWWSIQYQIAVRMGLICAIQKVALSTLSFPSSTWSSLSPSTLSSSSPSELFSTSASMLSQKWTLRFAAGAGLQFCCFCCGCSRYCWFLFCWWWDDEKCWRERLREEGPVERSVVAINFLAPSVAGSDSLVCCCCLDSCCPTAVLRSAFPILVAYEGNICCCCCWGQGKTSV